MSMTNFKLEIDSDGIATVTWDMPGRSMNVWNEDAIGEFAAVVERLHTDDTIKGMVITSGKETFCAGADLTLLSTMKARFERLTIERGEKPAMKALFEEASKLGQMFRRLELAKKPVVAALNGTALGGGFELALAAHGRIAAQNDKTRLGLPEVKVGLIPGAGGTQRIPRLVPAQDALQLIVQGQELKLDRASAMKLVDKVVPPADLIAEAKAWIKANPKAAAPWDRDGFKLPGGPVYSAGGSQVWPAAAAIARRETNGNYPAVKAILSAVYEGLLVPFDTALRIEARYFTSVLRSPEAAAMIRTLFMSMGELNKGARRPPGVAPSKLQTIAVIGAGFMGAGIAQVSARAGMTVYLVDRDEAAAQKGKEHIIQALTDQVNKGRMKAAEKDMILERVRPTANYDDLRSIDFVVEAVFENRDVKKDVIEKTLAVIGKDVIFASNTSTLPITSLAAYSSRPEDFVGVHFFSPVDRMMLVEVILGKKTNDRALATAMDFVKAIRKTPIVVNDSRGFFANRCVLNYVREGHIMLTEGVPAAMVENLARMAGMPVGPLSLNDEVALDLAWKILQATKTDLGVKAVDERQENLLEEMVVKRERFGRKNGKGFYDYPQGGKKSLWPGIVDIIKPTDNPDKFDRDDLMRRFLVTQALEAARCVEDGVITDMREADVGSILGFGFSPFTGGVLTYIDQMGTEAFVALCEFFAKKYGKRFKPNKLLKEMAEKNETFYGRFASGAGARQAA